MKDIEATYKKIRTDYTKSSNKKELANGTITELNELLSRIESLGEMSESLNRKKKPLITDIKTLAEVAQQTAASDQPEAK